MLFFTSIQRACRRTKLSGILLASFLLRGQSSCKSHGTYVLETFWLTTMKVLAPITFRVDMFGISTGNTFATSTGAARSAPRSSDVRALILLQAKPILAGTTKVSRKLARFIAIVKAEFVRTRSTRNGALSFAVPLAATKLLAPGTFLHNITVGAITWAVVVRTILTTALSVVSADSTRLILTKTQLSHLLHRAQHDFAQSDKLETGKEQG